MDARQEHLARSIAPLVDQGLRTPKARARLTAYMMEVGMKEKSLRIAVRMPERLVAEVDAYLESINRQHPGREFNRSDAIRELVYKGLEALGLERGDEEGE